MAIKILKRKAVVPAEPLINPRVPVPVEETLRTEIREAAPARINLKHAEKPLATSPRDFIDNPNGYRSPPRRACTLCGHLYSFPCDGDPASGCMNRQFHYDRLAAQGADQ